ncbi:hypothetical protein F4703DRAFT_1931366 [Phycomyces blakesleeanus]
MSLGRLTVDVNVHESSTTPHGAPLDQITEGTHLVMIRRFHRRDREFLSANQDDDCTDFSDF